MAKDVEFHTPEVLDKFADVIIASLNEYALKVEGDAKRPLQKGGRGVVTGTYRRSIHAANPRYNYAGDNVPVKTKRRKGRVIIVQSGPERAGQGGGAEKLTDTIIGVKVGSGMSYAGAVEGRHKTIKRSFDKWNGKLESIIRRHAKRAGFD